jgi:cell division protein FtsI (penicillin-binding protein 3)
MSPAVLRTLRIQLTGHRHVALETGRQRLILLMMLFSAGALFLVLRLADLTILQARDGTSGRVVSQPYRADITDRNGVVMATSLKVQSLGVKPGMITDRKKVARELVKIIPELNLAAVEKSLNSAPKKFHWIKRKLTPRQVLQVNAIGEPGLQFREEYMRIYPNGMMGAHVIGGTDVDGKGIAGLEKFLEDDLRNASTVNTVKLTLDSRVQYALEDELNKAMAKSNAIGGFGLVMDANSGAIVAMASLPTFNPNDPNTTPMQNRFNAVTKGTYELGSTFKPLAIAQGLEEGTTTIGERYDATRSLRVAGFSISDFHAKKRWLTTTETFIYSSNIGTALIADEYGAAKQRVFLEKLGFLAAPSLEVPEVGRPQLPAQWGRLASMTVAYGHGMAVTPLNLGQGLAAIVNGGHKIQPTLLQSTADRQAATPGERVIRQETSDHIRALMRLTVTQGTGNHADLDGYRVGGKTGTAEKPKAGRYDSRANIATFAGAFPMDAPRYVVIASLDEPRGAHTGGLVAAPIVANLILRSAPALGVTRDTAKDVDVTAYMPYIANPRKPKKPRT